MDSHEKVDALNKLSIALQVDDPDSSICMANESIALSEKLDYSRGMAEGLFNLGNVYYVLDEFKPTINNYLKALRVYEDLPPSNEFGILCLQLGDLNSFTGRYLESLPYYRKAITIFDNLDHEAGTFRATWLTAYTHWILDDYDSSHYYTEHASSLISSDDDHHKFARIYMQYARTYRKQFIDSGDTSFLNTSIHWLNKAKDLQGLNCYTQTAINYNIGGYSLDYKVNEKNNEGVEFFLKTIHLAENCNKEAYYLVPMVYRRLGEYKYKQGDLDTAVILLNKALALIDQELSCFSIKDYINPVRAYESRWFLKQYKSYSYENLYLVYLSQGDNKQALEHYILWERSKEERYLEKNKNLIALLEAETENEKTQNQINILAKDNELKALKINQSRAFNYGLIGLFIILVLVGLLFLRQNKLKTEHKTVVLEQKLLRLQMNPHFIFNALSNILNFIDSNENKKASRYLTTFSKLLRTTLESTREDLVPFEKEVGSLKNYLELQKLRYSSKFNYAIEVDENIEQEDMSIPPMLVQPFIENAIEHGIRHKKTMGRINVRFILKGEKILCEIEDDGVGREKAWEAEYSTRRGHKSLAIEIIKDRIKILNKKFSQKIKLEIIDMKSDKLEASGTKVLLDLPYGSVY